MGCGGSKSKADANGGGGSGGLSAGQDSNLGARETSFMSPATLSAVAKEANVTLEEAEVLYLRFKLLEPDHTTNEVLVTHFGHKIGTGCVRRLRAARRSTLGGMPRRARRCGGACALHLRPPRRGEDQPSNE